MLTRARSSLLLAALVLAGCNENDPFIPGAGEFRGPRDVSATYDWIFETFNRDTGRPLGHPSVVVKWSLPADWNRDPFRVYARRGSQGSFSLVGTTTSCEGGECRFVDTNVVGGTRYEYFVSTVDRGSGAEAPSDFRVEVNVPVFAPPPAPRADSVFALDNSLWLRWRSGGAVENFWKYQVWLVSIDGQRVDLYQAGETDATGFLDLRARNGSVYGYRIAAVNTQGQVSDLSPVMTGVPRPDFHSELIYAFSDSTARSGFRFVAADSLDPIVSGSSPQAQWRLEVANGRWQIRPLGDTEVVSAGRTTALVCGPGRDRECRAAFQAPASGYTRNPVAVDPEFSYVFRVRGADGRIHYGVIRASILGSSGGKALMIFDWAYQLRPDDPRLDRRPG
ncbi:MAG TPA: hypothetical protein VGR37_14220 [Longimicrobiaceae bacterium]|nr:hypothetical protein [Longimicrobiaceae bacterium]